MIRRNLCGDKVAICYLHKSILSKVIARCAACPLCHRVRTTSRVARMKWVHVACFSSSVTVSPFSPSLSRDVCQLT